MTFRSDMKHIYPITAHGRIFKQYIECEQEMGDGYAFTRFLTPAGRFIKCEVVTYTPLLKCERCGVQGTGRVGKRYIKECSINKDPATHKTGWWQFLCIRCHNSASALSTKFHKTEQMLKSIRQTKRKIK